MVILHQSLDFLGNIQHFTVFCIFVEEVSTKNLQKLMLMLSVQKQQVYNAVFA